MASLICLHLWICFRQSFTKFVCVFETNKQFQCILNHSNSSPFTYFISGSPYVCQFAQNQTKLNEYRITCENAPVNNLHINMLISSLINICILRERKYTCTGSFFSDSLQIQKFANEGLCCSIIASAKRAPAKLNK